MISFRRQKPSATMQKTLFRSLAVKKNKSSSLRRKMVFYFLLIAFANIFVGGELLWEIKSEKYRQHVHEQATMVKNGQQEVGKIYDLLDHLSNKFIIMIGILIIVSAIVLSLFVIRIASPIQYMIDKSKSIAEGDLATTIEIKSNDEIATLGNLINDLTANLQEIIAQLNHVFDTLEEAMLRTESKLDRHKELEAEFKIEKNQIRDAVENLALLKDSFKLFQIDKSIFGSDNEKTKRLGEILLDAGVITEEQLQQAIEIQYQKGGFLGKILTELGFVDQQTLVEYLTKQDT